MSLISLFQTRYGMSYARARLVADRLKSMAAGAIAAAHRPENKLADAAVLLGVPYADAKSVAFDVLDIMSDPHRPEPEDPERWDGLS